LHAVAEIELLEDVCDVRLDGCLADVESLPDLGVREAVGNQAKDLSLTRSELVRIGGPFCASSRARSVRTR
jgi:hypothetical protein